VVVVVDIGQDEYIAVEEMGLGGAGTLPATVHLLLESHVEGRGQLEYPEAKVGGHGPHHGNAHRQLPL
jgi:hypothetical protein